MSASTASANIASWQSAHGKLWYDDRWYRVAWLVWPQAIGLLLFVSLWLFHPARQSSIPWGRPVPEAPRFPLVVPQIKPPPSIKWPPPPQLTPLVPPAPPVDVLAPCRSGDFSQIIQACSSLIASGNLRGSNIPNAYWLRGWAYYSTKQYQPAMNDYDRAIAMSSPGNPQFYNDRGVLWLAVGNYDRAMQDFDQAILLKSDFAIAYVNRGGALRNLKRPYEALVALNTAIEHDPKERTAYENRAFVNEDASNWRAVYDDAMKLIQLAPDYRMGYELRGHAYLESGQQLEAIADFTKAILIDPNAIYDYRMRGRAFYLQGLFDSAAADFDAALRINPKDSETLSFINDLRRKQRGR
jgi:tetratricopeptide (TPR) repeat protein